MIYASIHAFDLILDKQWSEWQELQKHLIYPLKGYKFNISSEPRYYQSPLQKELFKTIEQIRLPYSKVSCAIPIKNPDGTFINRLDDALRMIDFCLDIMKREPSWWLINEPYNYGITYEQITVMIKLFERAILQRTPKRDLYLGDCLDEWQTNGWYELRNRKGVLFPKCEHYGVTMPTDKGYNPSIKLGRMMRSGCKVICDECGVYDYETNPEYENFRAWENPAHNWKRAVTAIAGSIYDDFCWWAWFFHTNKVGQSIGIMTNTLDKKNPRMSPILKYFLKPPYGEGNG